MVSCIIHVFGVLAEYALILKMIQDLKRQETKSLKERKDRVRKGKGDTRENCDYQGVYKQVGMLHILSLKKLIELIQSFILDCICNIPAGNMCIVQHIKSAEIFANIFGIFVDCVDIFYIMDATVVSYCVY